mgnify:CR=1 FL=1
MTVFVRVPACHRAVCHPTNHIVCVCMCVCVCVCVWC